MGLTLSIRHLFVNLRGTMLSESKLLFQKLPLTTRCRGMYFNDRQSYQPSIRDWPLSLTKESYNYLVLSLKMYNFLMDEFQFALHHFGYLVYSTISEKKNFGSPFRSFLVSFD